MLFSRDFVLNVYVKHNEVVKLGMDYKFTVLNAEASLAVDFMGTDSPADDIYAVAGQLKKVPGLLLPCWEITKRS